METVTISRELLEALLAALNDVENRSVGGSGWHSTYALAGELSRVLRREQ